MSAAKTKAQGIIDENAVGEFQPHHEPLINRLTSVLLQLSSVNPTAPTAEHPKLY